MLLLLAGLAAVAAEPADWEKAESAHLRNIRQVTSDFVRAGEGYFSPDGKEISFQAEEKDTGNPFYQIFVMDLASGKYRRVSPGVGKTTCSYWRPDGKRIIFASSHLDPEAKKKQEEEYVRREEVRRSGKRQPYLWDFDPWMDIFESNPDGTDLKRLTDMKGYVAEGSYSPDGKQIVLCGQRDGNLELYLMDADGSNVRQLTHTPGCYNGGPFFSPDGKRVIFRSDRKKKDYLQLYVINADGSGERALTDDPNWVQWGPYWYKDGKHIIYAGADHSNPTVRPNYDLYWMDIDEAPPNAKECRNNGLRQSGFSTLSPFSRFSTLSESILYPICTALRAGGEKEQPYIPKKKVRITYAPGADVLPVFSPDGTKLMWTSTRGGGQPAQLYMADFIPPKDE
jgi:Tol biopolymer transport system component